MKSAPRKEPPFRRCHARPAGSLRAGGLRARVLPARLPAPSAVLLAAVLTPIGALLLTAGGLADPFRIVVANRRRPAAPGETPARGVAQRGHPPRTDA